MSELVNLIELSQLLGIAPDWLHTQAKQGTIPCLRAGRLLVFNARAVQERLAELAAVATIAQPPHTPIATLAPHPEAS